MKNMMVRCDQKGIIIFVVVGILMVVGLLAAASLTLLSSQATLGAHQVNKIRAYYIGMGALHWAQAMKRTNATYVINWDNNTMPDSNVTLPPGFRLIMKEAAASNPVWANGTSEITINITYPFSS